MRDGIGLNGAWHKTKGARLDFRIKEFCWELRYAWQRAWRGYDFTDVFELGFNFVERMPFLLREFKENNVALFPSLDDENRLSLTEEETDAILDKMIFYFENCNEDVVYKRLYNINPYEDAYDYEKWKLVSKESERCWNEAMCMFSKWSMYLWY